MRPIHKNVLGTSIFALAALMAHAENEDVFIRATALPDLPVPVANNAVVSVTAGNTQYILSFSGIGAGLARTDIHDRTFVFDGEKSVWVEQAPLPGNADRLAATAVSVGSLAYVFGGYTVADDGSEVSTPWVHSFDPVTGRYSELSAMPIPVDDAVSVSYAKRYVYLISGWHDLGNVNLVQRYDTVSDSWTQATPIPGKALFGHAGGIVGNTLLYCDGVAVRSHPNRARSFVASDECFVGIIDEDDSRRIDWQPVDSHPGLPRYRMAAAGVPEQNAVLFVGGSENPYNFNGIGYDGTPSEPASSLFLYSFETQHWTNLGQHNPATMDHRGLVKFQGNWVTVGGIRARQEVTGSVLGYSFDSQLEPR